MLDHWDAITCDMQEHYQLEVDNLLLLEHRSWRWLERRITGLLNIHSRIRGILETQAKET